MTDQPHRPDGVVRIRLSGDPADVEHVALILRSAADLELVEQPAPYANRREPGVRVYLTGRVLSGRAGCRPGGESR